MRTSQKVNCIGGVPLTTKRSGGPAENIRNCAAIGGKSESQLEEKSSHTNKGGRDKLDIPFDLSDQYKKSGKTNGMSQDTRGRGKRRRRGERGATNRKGGDLMHAFACREE